jgi:SdpI/YhfL family protein
VAIVTISIPLILRIVPPNGVYGFRVSATRSPEIWYPANEFMGWALLVAAAIAAALQIMLPRTTKWWLLWTAFLMPICGAVVASFAYLSRLLNAV